MQPPPDLFDRDAIAAHRARAQREALFLHDAAIAEIKERLIEVNRAFTAPAIVTGHAAPWRAAFPDATILADDPTLGMEQGAHDLIIHALALHLANDPVGQLVQCRRALRPDGLMLAVLFGGQTLHELRAALSEAETRLTGGLSPRVVPMGEIRDLGALLQRAGFALPVADAARHQVSYATPFGLMHDLRHMGEANPMAGRKRGATPRALLQQAAAIYAQNFGAPDGRIGATFDLIYLTGWCPAPSQQQPLRPGSAQQRLADALNTREHDPEAPAPGTDEKR